MVSNVRNQIVVCAVRYVVIGFNRVRAFNAYVICHEQVFVH